MAFDAMGLSNQGASFNIPSYIPGRDDLNFGSNRFFIYASHDDLSEIVGDTTYFLPYSANISKGDLFFIKALDGTGFYTVSSMVADGIIELVSVGTGGGSGVYLQRDLNLNDVQSPSLSRLNLGVQVGTDVQAWSTILSGLSLLTDISRGIVAKTGSNTFSPVTLTGTANQITITNGNGNGNPTFSLPTLVNIGGISASGGAPVVSFSDQAGANYVTISNPSGASFAKIAANAAGSSANLALSPKGPGVVAVISPDGLEVSKFGLTDPTNEFAFLFSGPTSLTQNVAFQVPNTSAPLDSTFISNGDGTTRWDSPLLLSGGTMTGPIVLDGAPVNALNPATKAYVDDLVAAIGSGLHPHEAVNSAATTALTATYNNGTAGVGATLTNSGTQAQFSVPGTSGSYLPPLNARIVVPAQASQFQNGIYVLTNQGSVSTNWVLTRATDFNADGADNIEQYASVNVTNGAAANSTWLMNSPGPYIVGTTALNWVQFKFGVYESGTGINIAGNVISVANTAVTGGTYTYPNSVTVNAQGQLTHMVSGGTPLLLVNNLGDVVSKPIALSNLGGQPLNGVLSSIAGATLAEGYISYSGSGTSVYRTFSSPQGTINIVHPSGRTGATTFDVSAGTPNTLPWYNDSTGAFDSLGIGSGLNVSGGNLVATGGGASNGYTFIGQYELRDVTPQRKWDFAPGNFATISNFGSLHFMFSNMTSGLSTGGNPTHFTMQMQTEAGVFPYSIILSTQLPTNASISSALYGFLDVTLNLPATSSRNMTRRINYGFSVGARDIQNPPNPPDLSLFLTNITLNTFLMINNNQISGFRFACDYGENFDNSLAGGYIYLYGSNPI